MEQSTTILNSAFASFNIVVLCSITPHIDLGNFWKFWNFMKILNFLKKNEIFKFVKKNWTLNFSRSSAVIVYYYIMILFKQFYWLSCCHLTFRKIWYCLIKTRSESENKSIQALIKQYQILQNVRWQHDSQ
jgi:hypothetical protein